MRGVRGDHTLDLGGVEGEVLATLPLDDGGSGDPRDLGVHLIRGLERRHRPARPGVREQQGLQHLVRAVGGEHLLRQHPVELGDGGAEFEGRPIGIPVPVHPRQLRGERISERRGRGFGRFVGVQTDRHVDLGGVVPLECTKVVTNADHLARC